MFLESQDAERKSYYKEVLSVVGSLSRLFSNAIEPYIEYHIAEKLFCKAFDAEDLSRSDVSADARKGNVGIGIKTFLNKNGKSHQKVAEFNGDHNLFSTLNLKDKVIKISELRNERLETTMRMHGLESMMYHCIVRSAGEISVYEETMDLISIPNIKGILLRKNTIHFTDGLNEYSFSVSKSTLLKRFNTANVSFTVPVTILDDPLSILARLGEGLSSFTEAEEVIESKIYLPLFSEVKGEKVVSTKSGLNQWNAGGRQRNVDELYIPIPAWIHKKFPDFLPPRDTVFDLVLPDNTELKAKVCQDGGKALMSDPNSALGKWLLRDVLRVPAKEIITYHKLLEVGFDSVELLKVAEGKYRITFTEVGSFDEFKQSVEEELQGEQD